MNPPQVYMCSPSWTLLPPPFPYHPSGSSQCTSPKHPVSCIEEISILLYRMTTLLIRIRLVKRLNPLFTMTFYSIIIITLRSMLVLPRKYIYLTLVAKPFSKIFASCSWARTHLPTNGVWCSSSSTDIPTLIMSAISIIAIWVDVFHVVILTCISLMMKDVGRFSNAY